MKRKIKMGRFLVVCMTENKSILEESKEKFSPCFHPFAKVIHPKYCKHLKKGDHQSHLGRQKNGLVSGRLACTSSKSEILNKIGI